MKGIIVLLAAITVFFVAGCGEQPADETAAENTSEAVAEEPVTNEAPETSEEIVLPSGWAMTDAITAAEVEAIMGVPGFGYFPEAASNAQGGKPVGSFNIGSIPYSKVRFDVDVAGGRSGYDLAAGYLTNPVEVPGEMWDAAVLGDVPAGDRMEARIVVLKGEVCFNVSWEPAVFPGLDKTETSVKLAELLIANLYTR
jgi:hypothetical protein